MDTRDVLRERRNRWDALDLRRPRGALGNHGFEFVATIHATLKTTPFNQRDVGYSTGGTLAVGVAEETLVRI